jgi:hypothetical protein
MDKVKNKLFFLMLIIFACEEERSDPLPYQCYLIPETGPCKAVIPRYYYDQLDKKCKEFTWGGCDGVVPFETMKDCKKSCSE